MEFTGCNGNAAVLPCGSGEPGKTSRNEPSVDTGNGTMNLMYLNNGRPMVKPKSWTEKPGVVAWRKLS